MLRRTGIEARPPGLRPVKPTPPFVLRVVTECDIAELMTWFPDERSCDVWSGPNFRYPFTMESFREDLLWTERATYGLRNDCDELVGFGQLYERFACINLARLAVAPRCRGQGVGKELVRLLMREGRKSFDLDQYSLYVYRDNRPALGCYRALGFEIQPFPESEPLADRCYYLTRPVAKGDKNAS